VVWGRDDRLLWASIGALYAFQALHVVVPADAVGGRWSWSATVVVGLLEAVLLVACAGLVVDAGWARPLAAWSAGLVGLVFLLYHGLPFETAVTNPYPGEVGVAPWIPVIGIIAAAAGTVVAGLSPRRRAGRGGSPRRLPRRRPASAG
jgi:hypothetical protein